MGIANTLIEVKGGNINKAVKDWKASVEKYGIKEILQDKKQYTKPSERKRLQKEEAIRKNKKRKK